MASLTPSTSRTLSHARSLYRETDVGAKRSAGTPPPPPPVCDVTCLQQSVSEVKATLHKIHFRGKGGKEKKNTFWLIKAASAEMNGGQGQNEVIMAVDGWVVAGGLCRDEKRRDEASFIYITRIIHR